MADAKAGRALMGGTTAMRAAGQTYLPQFEAESDKGYAARLASSWLFNGYRKTVRDMTGRVFSKSVEIEGGELQEEAENIDMQGRDLSAFARDVFEAALGGSGVSYIMVDAPRRDTGLTKAQAAAANMRPYLVHVPVEDVLGWKTETVGSKTTLSMWRQSEVVTEENPEDEFNPIKVRQIRVLDMVDGGVRVRIYREDAKLKKWFVYDEYMTEATEITVTPLYANRTGFFTGEPMLEDLADVNIAHWQSQSDQRNILHFARVPILFAAGRDDDEPLTLSAGTATTARDPSARLTWVEHSGASIGAGRDDLKDLEFQMQVMGLQLLVGQAATATGAALDSVKETSPLAMTADNMKDALERALSWFAMYQGKEQSFTVNVNKDFGVSMLTAQEITAMLSAVNTGNMSRETFIREMARRGFIAEDIDVDAEIERIEDDEGVLMVENVSE